MRKIFALSLLVLLSIKMHASSDGVNLTIKVFDKRTLKELDANVSFYLNSDFILYDSAVATNGELSKTLFDHGRYVIEIEVPNYFRHTDVVWVTDASTVDIQKEYYLNEVQPGYTITLTELTFYFNSFDLKPECRATLDVVADFILANPELCIEVGAHTDDEGSSPYNVWLSDGRAKAIAKYLVAKGINETSLVVRGYGEDRPIDKGITKAAKARNRRVEFVVVDL